MIGDLTRRVIDIAQFYWYEALNSLSSSGPDGENYPNATKWTLQVESLGDGAVRLDGPGAGKTH
jgi:hypothetical protein